MNTLQVHNPATSQLITTLPADNAANVASRTAAARAAQPAWAPVPMAERIACIPRFRAALLAELDTLAATLTAEMGKPVSQGKNEINGLPGRLDFFMEQAERATADGAIHNTGQSCCSVERIYVHESIHDAFVQHFLATVANFKLGDPVAKDATLLTGGKRRPGPSNWFEPTVLTNVNHRMELMREESFGPVIGIQKVSGDEEAVALMNDTRYGLTAGVCTKDESAARALLARVNAGSVYWNCCDRVSPRLPWSGHGDSGVGLTLSTHGIQTFTRPKAWHLWRP